MTFTSVVRASPTAPEILATLTVTPREDAPGWLDFLLSAADTLAIGERNVHWACKLTVTGHEARARVIAAGMIPIRWTASR